MAGKKKVKRIEMYDNTEITDKGDWATHFGLIVRFGVVAAFCMSVLTFFMHYM